MPADQVGRKQRARFRLVISPRGWSSPVRMDDASAVRLVVDADRRLERQVRGSSRSIHELCPGRRGSVGAWGPGCRGYWTGRPAALPWGGSPPRGSARYGAPRDRGAARGRTAPRGRVALGGRPRLPPTAAASLLRSRPRAVSAPSDSVTREPCILCVYSRAALLCSGPPWSRDGATSSPRGRGHDGGSLAVRGRDRRILRRRQGLNLPMDRAESRLLPSAAAAKPAMNMIS